jgi:hypothetical protein
MAVAVAQIEEQNPVRFRHWRKYGRMAPKSVISGLLSSPFRKPTLRTGF